MTAAAKQLAKQALALPKKERAELVGRLIKSLDEDEGEKLSSDEWNKVWAIEIKKRMKDLRSGKVKAIPASQVMAELRAKYG